MDQNKTETTVKTKDRKLGDEWRDWDGAPGSQDHEIDEKLSTFFILAASILFILVSLIYILWYMMKPRVDQFHPSIANLIEWSGKGFIALFFVLLVSECIAILKFKKSFLPYKWIEKLLLTLLPMTVWLGTKFGLSRDRVGNSFIKVHNVVTKLSAGRLNTDKLLILLPRCLKKETRKQIMNRLDESSHKILTVGGGEEARKAIRQFSPSIILAFACERDLMSGIKEVAEKVPVIAIPNKRPEGPCKNTHVILEELDEALEFIKDRKTESLNC
jgi:hypothetical protein